MNVKDSISIVFVLLIATFVVVVRCSNYEGYNDYEEEELQAMIISSEKLLYAGETSFLIHIINNGEIIRRAHSTVFTLVHPRSPYFDPSFTELVLVHNEAEAVGLPDNIIVAWPIGGEHSQNFINGIHWAVNLDADGLIGPFGSKIRRVITLEEFGLTYPLAVKDLVDNWEKVNELWNAFTLSEQNTIRWIATGGPIDE